MPRSVTVAIPVRDGGELLARTLARVREQELDRGLELELLVCDSGSGDGSVATARRFGASVMEIAPSRFSHGGTRNLLMERSHGDYVAFLTQDAIPADNRWLSQLLAGFELTNDVGLVFGPYLPRPGASPMVARELLDWFAGFSPAGAPRIDRLALSERDLPARTLLGPVAFFTDANGCIARRAWERAPFREVAYAEDHALAIDMLRAGYAKVFLPDAGVIHSHEYSPWEWLQRAFDEARALREVYGFVPSGAPAEIARNVWGRTGADWRWLAATGQRRSITWLWRSAVHHLVRGCGAQLGARAGRLPPALVRRLSLERRAS
jgi:rhamnosyltransferase